MHQLQGDIALSLVWTVKVGRLSVAVRGLQRPTPKTVHVSRNHFFTADVSKAFSLYPRNLNGRTDAGNTKILHSK